MESRAGQGAKEAPVSFLLKMVGSAGIDEVDRSFAA